MELITRLKFFTLEVIQIEGNKIEFIFKKIKITYRYKIC